MVKVTRKPGDVSPEQLKVILEGIQGKRGKVGWFESAKYPDGTPVAYVSAIQEFGYAAGGIPPRPFIRPTIRRELSAWKGIAAAVSKRVVDGLAQPADIMEAIGLKAATDIKKTINQISSPRLKPATIAARRRRNANATDKPLIDTGHMYETLTNIVEDA